MRTRAIVTALAALSLLSLGGCGGDDEDGLTVYSGRSEPLIGPLLDDVEDQGGPAIDIRYGETPQLASTILEEGGNSPADVFFSQDAGALGALSSEGLLIKLPADILNQVPKRFRAEDGTWVGTSGRARVIAYGPGVAQSDLPDSVLDLTRPEWRGRVGWAPTNGSFEAFVTAMRKTLGEDVAREWLEGMVANETESYESNIPIRDAIAEGEIDIGLINHYYVAEAVAEDPEYPVEVHFPPRDIGSMVNVAGVGILESTERREDALAFVREMLSENSQRFFAETSLEYPLAAGVEADPSLLPLSQVPDPGVRLSDLADLEGTLELLQETGAL